MMDIPGQPGMGMGALNLGDIFGKAFGGRKVRRRLSVSQSYELLITEEADKLLDPEAVNREAVDRGGAERHRLHRRDRQGRRPRRDPRRGRLAARACSATCCR